MLNNLLIPNVMRTSRQWNISIGLAVALLLPPLCGEAAFITDDFNDSNDQGWTHYEPLAPVGAPGFYSFPTGPLDGAQYRIQATASPNPSAFGPGRAGSLRLDTTDFPFGISVYLTDWDNQMSQSFGVFARISSLGLGSTDGYAFTYSTDGFVRLSRIDDEMFSTLASVPILLDPAKDYRFLFTGRGTDLIGRLFDHDINVEVASLRIADSTYDSGATGLFVAANSAGAADATFDFFESSSVVPEPSTWSLLGICAAILTGKILLRRRAVLR